MGLEAPKALIYMYAETPKALFSASNAAIAPKRDAEGVERLYLGICGDVVVSSRQHDSPILMFVTRRLLTEQPSYFLALFTPAAYFTDGNLHVLATWIRPCPVTPTRVSVCLDKLTVDTCHSLRTIVYRGVRVFDICIHSLSASSVRSMHAYS